MATVTVKSAAQPAEPTDPAEPAAGLAVPADGLSVTVTDSRRRTLKVRKLTALDRMRLAMILGDHTDNRTVALYANLAASVEAIGADPLPRLRTMVELEALVQRLDEDGLAAVIEGWRAAGWIATDPEAAERERLEATKNSVAKPDSAPALG